MLSWRAALLADIHGNLPALEAALEDVDRRGVDAVYHLGDLVGYAPWPDEVVALLAERRIPGVSGNYDSTTAVGAEHCGCRAESPEQEALAHESYTWTLARVSEATKAALRALPFRLDVRPDGGHHSGPTLVLFHGAPTLNTLYWDADRSDDFARRMAEKAGAREGDALAFGHTHVPWTREIDGILYLNAGSVGRPKDGDPRACYAIVTAGEDGFTTEHVRVDYDIERAAAAIEGSELPDSFVEDLRTGGARKASADP